MRRLVYFAAAKRDLVAIQSHIAIASRGMVWERRRSGRFRWREAASLDCAYGQQPVWIIADCGEAFQGHVASLDQRLVGLLHEAAT